MNGGAKWMVPSLLILALSSAAFAESSAYGRLNNRIDNREANREARTEQGDMSSQGVRKEANRMNRLDALQDNELHARVEGKVTPTEQNGSALDMKQIKKKSDRKKQNTETSPSAR